MFSVWAYTLSMPSLINRYFYLFALPFVTLVAEPSLAENVAGDLANTLQGAYARADTSAQDGDYLIIERLDTNSIRFCLQVSEKKSEHVCSLEGTALKVGSEFHFIDPSREVGDRIARDCVLRLKTEADKIVVEDSKKGCTLYYCGYHASLDGAEFSISSKLKSKLSCDSVRDLAALIP